MKISGKKQGRYNELDFKNRIEGTQLIYKAMLDASPPTNTEEQ